MKQVLIVGSRVSGTKNDPAVLYQRMSESGSARIVYWEDMVFSVAVGDVAVTVNGQNVLNPKPDLVVCLGWYKNGKQSIYRDIAFAFSQVLVRSDIPFWNTEMAQQRSTTKLSSSVQLALNDIPVVPTQFSLAKQLVLEAAELPFIAKAVAASRGSDNYLVKDEALRRQLMDDDIRYLVQPFLPNDHDLRLICMGGTVQLALKRSRDPASTSHMNNTSQGAKARWIALDDMHPKLLTISEKICKILGRELAGIDFIPDATTPTGYSCLEVNAIPQLTSGHDTDIKMQAFINALQKD